jgi:hypothetical protein
LEASVAGLGPRSGADAGSEKESLVSEDKSQPEPELEPDRLVINKLGSPADEFFVVSLSAQPNIDTTRADTAEHESPRQEEENLGGTDLIPTPIEEIEEIESFVGPNSEMQLIQTKHLSTEASMKEAEFVAMGRMRAFCAKILKTLVPPLLREVEKVSALRSEIEPCTPRRSVRISAPG